MPLTRFPETASPATVAQVLASHPDTAMVDVLLAQACASHTSWTPLYDRSDIGPEVWARWSTYLARRAAHDASRTEYCDTASPDARWLFATLREVVRRDHPAQGVLALRAELRRILTTATRSQENRPDSARIWWRAMLASCLAAGDLGAVTAEELAVALAPWLGGSVNAMSLIALWAVPALTAGLEQGLLTSEQVAGYLQQRGGYALVDQLPHERAMLEVPGWRAAWWEFFKTPQAQALGGQWAEAVRLHCGNIGVLWSQWPAAELEAWWSWLVTAHLGRSRVHGDLPRLLTRTLAQAPDGAWLGQQPAFRLALRPLLEAADPTTREMGFRVLGMTHPGTPDEGPAGTSVGAGKDTAPGTLSVPVRRR